MQVYVFNIAIFLAALLLASKFHEGAALFGNKKKKEEEKSKEARENINAGLNEMRRMAQDPRFVSLFSRSAERWCFAGFLSFILISMVKFCREHLPFQIT